MSYMNDDCDPFGVPYAPLKVKQKKEKSNEKYTLDNEDYKNHHSRIICNDRELYLHQVVDLLNELHEEKEQLQHDATILIQSNQDYRKENEQLKQRNDRQAKQLDRIYQLIEEKDWRTLNDILDDFKRCEEQLQREWRTYE